VLLGPGKSGPAGRQAGRATTQVTVTSFATAITIYNYIRCNYIFFN
jgi:hypothetical protein